MPSENRLGLLLGLLGLLVVLQPTGAAAPVYAAYSWGSNAYGQGGAAGAFNGSLVNALSAGAFHTCGLESEQRLFCFGRNTHGQLGSLVNVGTATATPDPVLVVVQIGNVTYEGSWRAVSAGGNHTCAIFAGDSGLYCFGSNAAGQLGTGKPGIALPEPRPQRAKAPGDVTGWRAVSAGGTMTCAVSLDGRLYCFGTLVSEATGAALFSSREPLLLPFPAGVKGWATVAVGSNHMCALGSNNQLYCLGSNLYGQLGTGAAGVSDGSGQPPDATALVQAVLPPTVLVGYKDVSAGESHTCAVCTGGNMYCFGRNSHGQLGSPGAAGSDAATPLATVITKAPGVRSWSRVVCGGRHTCGLSSADQAFCFGSNEEGQLGLGIANASLITAAAAPLAIVNSAGSKWLTLTAGGRHTLGLSSTSAELNSVTADYTISVPVELVTKWADACRKLRSAVAVRFKALQKKKLAGYSLSLLPGDGCSSSAGGAALTHTAVYRISTDVAKLVNAMSTRKELRMVLNRSKAPCGASLSVSLVAVRTQAATAPGDGSWPGAGVPAAALMTESDMKRYRAAACKNTTAGRRRKLSL